MNTAYVGILTSNGLRLFGREDSHTVQTLSDRLHADELSRSCGLWFVMDDKFERTLQQLIQSGQRESAWMFLQEAARDFGLSDFGAEPSYSEAR